MKNGATGDSIKGGQRNARAAYGIDLDATTSENLLAHVISALRAKTPPVASVICRAKTSFLSADSLR